MGSLIVLGTLMRIILLLGGALLLSSCQMAYLMKNSWHQMSLLAARQPLEKALGDSKVSEEEKRKIRLAMEVREFADFELGLRVDQLYTSYVKLDRPFVTWVVSASPRWKLESYLWSFPIVGKMPYKGFFSEAEAFEEERVLLNLNSGASEGSKAMDTYVRGVTAYSTLGWFKDPILSSMMRSKDHDLVDTLIHELVHATLYIKHQADFNERFAVFLGHKGRELFYLKKEGPNSPTLKVVQEENFDESLFSEFITKEIENLDSWYALVSKNSERPTEEQRQGKFAEIKSHFIQDLEPKLKTKNWTRFPEMKLNNARLTVFKTYLKNLNDFQQAYLKVGSNFKRFLERCKHLENHPDPEQGLKMLN